MWKWVSTIFKSKLWCSVLLLIAPLFLIAQNENKVAKALRELNNDTVSYIKQYIVAKKKSYIGKPLDSLLKDLPLIIDYGNDVVHRNRYLSPTTTLCFSSYLQRVDKLTRRKNPLIVTITWANPLDNRELPGLGLKLWGGEWTQAAYNYYKNKIIGNIETFKDDLDL
jgi:hypothetical protein